MTPHDEWDYDGVNEMILSDLHIGGQTRKLLVHFDRNGLAYTLDRDQRRAAGGREVRSEGQLDQQRRHEQVFAKTYGRPMVLPQYSTEKRQDVNVEGHLPGRARHQRPATGRVLTGHRPVLRADQPGLHGL